MRTNTLYWNRMQSKTTVIRFIAFLCFAIIISLYSKKSYAQGTAISDQANPTPNAGAILDLQPSATSNKTLLLPRLNPAFSGTAVNGMLYYDVASNSFKFYQNGSWVGLGNSSTLSVAGGGTGLTVGTSGGIPYYSSASAMTSSGVLTQYGLMIGGGAGAAPSTLAVGTSGQILRSAGSSSPIWSTPTFPNTATSGKLMIGNGTNWVESTPSFPNASATARKIIVSDGTNWIASTETYAVPGNSGNILFSDGTNWTSSATPSLGKASTTTGSLAFYNSSSSNATTLQAGNATGAVTYTLPTAAPASNGYVLASTTGGVMSWTATSSLPSGTNNGIMYNNNGATGYQTTGAATTTGTFLRGTSGGAPAWSTLVLPNSSTQNRILYSSASNTVGEIATANTSALITNNSGVPSFTLGTTANRVLRTDGNNITFAQVALGTDVTGNLSVSNLNSGSNASASTYWCGNGTWTAISSLPSGTQGGVLYYNTTNQWASTGQGGSGQVLTSNGNNAPYWSSPSCLRKWKNIGDKASPEKALQQIIKTPIYHFHYKPNMGTGDSLTDYVGVMADEAPWAMHYDGQVVNPINTLGYSVLGIQALSKENEALKAKIKALEEKNGKLETNIQSMKTDIEQIKQLLNVRASK